MRRLNGKRLPLHAPYLPSALDTSERRGGSWRPLCLAHCFESSALLTIAKRRDIAAQLVGFVYVLSLLRTNRYGAGDDDDVDIKRVVSLRQRSQRTKEEQLTVSFATMSFAEEICPDRTCADFNDAFFPSIPNTECLSFSQTLRLPCVRNPSQFAVYPSALRRSQPPCCLARDGPL